MENIIKLYNCIKNYSINDKKILVLDKVSYEFSINKFYTIMGHSGSGKSTLIQILGLLDNVTSGDIFIKGLNVLDLDENLKAKLRNENIGFIFQSFYLNPNLTALENVLLPTYINSSLKKSEAKTKAIKLLEDLGLGERIKHFPKQLSGGEQQRVAIARALINAPDIILADEPTGSLDEENEKLIFKLLQKISKKGKCVIVVSHNSEIKKYADIVLKLEKGKITEC